MVVPNQGERKVEGKNYCDMYDIYVDGLLDLETFKNKGEERLLTAFSAIW